MQVKSDVDVPALENVHTENNELSLKSWKVIDEVSNVQECAVQ